MCSTVCTISGNTAWSEDDMKSWDELYKELQTKDLDISKDLVELEKI